MGHPINKTELYRLRYPAGTKVMLTAPIEDKCTPKEIGDVMTVEYVDMQVRYMVRGRQVEVWQL